MSRHSAPDRKCLLGLSTLANCPLARARISRPARVCGLWCPKSECVPCRGPDKGHLGPENLQQYNKLAPETVPGRVPGVTTPTKDPSPRGAGGEPGWPPQPAQLGSSLATASWKRLEGRRFIWLVRFLGKNAGVQRRALSPEQMEA